MNQPVAASAAAAASQKKIIKLTSNQVFRQVLHNTANNTVELTALSKSNTALRGHTKACGLFDFNLIDSTELDSRNDLFELDNLLYDSIMNATDTNMKETPHDQLNMPDEHSIEYDLFQSELVNENVNPLGNNDTTKTTKSKFAKKVAEVSYF